MRYLACPSSHSLSAETTVPRFAVDLDLLPRRRSCSGTIGKRCASVPFCDGGVCERSSGPAAATENDSEDGRAARTEKLSSAKGGALGSKHNFRNRTSHPYM